MTFLIARRQSSSIITDPSYSQQVFSLIQKVPAVDASFACRKSASFFQQDKLKRAIQENIEFHQHGGNLRSIQTFKDKAIDRTLEKEGIKFIPDDQGGTGTDKVTEYLKDYYKRNYDPRGGYGKKLPGKYQSSHATGVVVENRFIEVLEPIRGRHKWDASLGPIGPDCANLTQLGERKGGDGFKFMCMPTFDNNTNREDEDQEECHVISVGGNDNWKFETAITNQLAHCTTHTFDCTLPDDGQPKRKPDRENIRFYDYCLAGTSYNDEHGRKYLSYVDMLHVASIWETPPLYLKLDVEGFEYDIFTSMIASLPKQLLPAQIQVELHWSTRMTGVSWMPRTRSSGELALFAGMMFTGGGYLPVHLDFNPYCAPCMEVLYVQGVC